MVSRRVVLSIASLRQVLTGSLGLTVCLRLMKLLKPSKSRTRLPRNSTALMAPTPRPISRSSEPTTSRNGDHYVKRATTSLQQNVGSAGAIKRRLPEPHLRGLRLLDRSQHRLPLLLLEPLLRGGGQAALEFGLYLPLSTNKKTTTMTMN